MTEFPFNGPVTTGDAQIDREHRDLLVCLREFDLARHNGDGHDGAVRALQFLLRHALTHFQSEEERMESAGYPDLPAHRADHLRLLGEVRGLVSLYHQKTVSAEVMGRFLSDRILGHLKGGDRQFAEWMNRR